MSGLIWSALGQSVANAGSTIGGMMLRDIDDQRKREDEERREARAREAEERREAAAIKRMEEADRIKSERDATREEELQKRVIKDTAAARARGQEIGRAREAAAYDKLAESSALAGEQGDVPLTKEQLAAFGSKDPSIARQYRGMGLIDQNLPLSAQERRLRGAEDELAGAMETGAHSSVIKGFQEIRKGVLDEIREENRDAQTRAREERLDAENRRRDERFAQSEARRDRQFQALLPLRQQQADASTTRAERPTGSSASSDKPATTADLNRQVTAAENILAEQLGVARRDVNAEIAALQRKANRGDSVAQEKLKAIEPNRKNYRDANDRLLQFKRNNPGGDDSAPAPSNNASGPGGRPALGSFFRP